MPSKKRVKAKAPSSAATSSRGPPSPPPTAPEPSVSSTPAPRFNQRLPTFSLPTFSWDPGWCLTQKLELDAVPDFLWNTLWFIGSVSLDILKYAIMMMRKPLALGLLLYLCFALVIRLWSVVVPALMTPICNLPLMSTILPICNQFPEPNKLTQPDFPNLIDIQSKFETILKDAASGTTVALDIKNSEAAIRDLTILVKLSSLVSKHTLATHLDGFVQAAKSAGRDLQRLGSRIGGSVDQILAMDDYVLRLLEQATKPPQLSTTGAILNALSPWKETPAQLAVIRRRGIEELWFQAAGVLETNVGKLTVEAEASLALLNNLESDLDVINEIISREAHGVKQSTDELLAELWTKLGGNKRKLENFKAHRSLLANIRQYRDRALIYVTNTLIQLQQLSSDLEDLRERVATPLLSAEESNIPLEVHIASIRRGIDRLTDGRQQAKQREDSYIRRLLDGDTLPSLDPS